MTEHQLIYEILSDHDWHSTREFVFTHHLTKASSRIGEMERKNKDFRVERNNTKINGVWWKEYKLKRQAPEQERLMPLSKIYF